MTTKNECKQCGNIMGEDEKYCIYCGSINPYYKPPHKSMSQDFRKDLLSKSEEKDKPEETKQLTAKDKFYTAFIVFLVVAALAAVLFNIL